MRVKELEGDFQGRIIETALRCGWRVYHVPDSRRVTAKGFFDLTLAHEGRSLVLFVEVKTNTGRLSVDQRWWLGMMLRIGQHAEMWKPRDWPRIERILTGRADP